MNSFGAILKREREARGVSLEEISEKTKIGVRMLKAIEDEQLAQLPGGIFTRSFLRQYARYLGIDEDPIISEYLKAEGSTSEPAPASASGTSKEMLSFPGVDESRDSGYPRLILTAVLVGIAVAAIFYGARQFTERRAPSSAAAQSESLSPPNAPAPPAPPEPSNPVDTSSPPASAEAVGSVLPTPAASAATAAASAQPPAMAQSRTGESGAREGQTTAAPVAPVSSAPVQKTAPAAVPVNPTAKPNGESPAADGGPAALLLQIDARKDCWISISADGQMQWQGTLQAERSRSVQARDSFRLRIGDAGAVALLLNGKPLPSLGRSGEVKTVTISAKGLAQAEP